MGTGETVYRIALAQMSLAVSIPLAQEAFSMAIVGQRLYTGGVEIAPDGKRRRVCTFAGRADSLLDRRERKHLGDLRYNRPGWSRRCSQEVRYMGWL